MSGIAARSTTLLALAALMLAVTASSGAATSAPRPRLLGIVPHAGSPRSFALPGDGGPTFGAGPVVYQGGSIMRTNTAYAIYWVPKGYRVASNYESLINRYFADVAAASGLLSNVYSAATQYYDGSSSVRYKSIFGGSYVDTNAFPASGCSDGQDSVCLTDKQVETEIQRVLTARGWRGGLSTVYFLMTPEGVGSCSDRAGLQCSTNAYCAYHNDFADSSGDPVVYANLPYVGAVSGCTYTAPGSSAQGFPNGHDADASINAISHEHNEAITDPLGDAWWANDGNEDEIADLCAGDFGSTPLGTANGQPYDQLINGHPYSLQEEWSNDDGSCVAGYTPKVAPTSIARPVLGGAAGEGQLLTTSDGSWAHAPSGYAYEWQRCAANGSGCGDISGATGPTYRLAASDVGHTFRAEVRATNAAGTSAAYVASAISPIVVPPPSSRGAPVLSGLAVVGKKLSTTNGSWSAQTTFAYQWLRCTASGTDCATVLRATAATYVPVAADAGKTLEARVVATNAAGTATAVSNRSGVVLGRPASRKSPHISGRARVGRRLTARRGSWRGAPKKYRFQWLRCNNRGRFCVLIRRATHSTYRLTKRDARHRLRVRVTAVNAAGKKAATSRATSRVPAAGT